MTSLEPPFPPSPEEESPDLLARILAEAVSEAGAIALEMSRRGVESWTKQNDSPVSEADMAVDGFLHDRLMGAAPDYGWLSEESVDTHRRLDRKRLWVVDPIDGTRAFLARERDWVVSAAVVEGGRPIAGALFAPVTGELFVAAAGRGATRNGAPLAAAQTVSLSGASVSGPAFMIDALVARAQLRGMPRVRSLALRLARVATGELDLAFASANCHDWDIAAADIIVQEARGVLTTDEGTVPLYNAPAPYHRPLVCAAPRLHSSALALAQGEADFSSSISRTRDRAKMTTSNGQKQLLHLVFGGELSELGGTTFKDSSQLDIVGIYPDYASAAAAWKAKAQQTVDNAMVRYFVVHLHRLLDPETNITHEH